MKFAILFIIVAHLYEFTLCIAQLDYPSYSNYYVCANSVVNSVDWHKTRVETEGGVLAPMSTSEIDNLALSLMTRLNMDRSMVGGSDKDVEGKWKWPHGQLFYDKSSNNDFGEYNNWHLNEPNNQNGHEDCLEKFEDIGSWNDMACSSHRAAFYMFPPSYKNDDTYTCSQISGPPTTTVTPSNAPSMITPGPSTTFVPSKAPSTIPTTLQHHINVNIINYTLPSASCMINTSEVIVDVICEFDDIDSDAGSTLTSFLKNYSDCTSNYTNSAVSTNGTTSVNATDVYKVITSVDPTLYGTESSIYQFCIRTELTGSKGNIEIFRGQQVTISFDYEGEFKVDDFSTEVYSGISTKTLEETIEFNLTAYVCELNGVQLINPPALSLGQNLYICVESDEDSIISELDSMTATKTGVSLDIVNIGNTFITGTGSSKLFVAIRLPAPFFEDSESLSISGTATLSPINNRRQSVRKLQTVDGDSTSFEVNVDIEEADSSLSGASSSIATSSISAMSVLLMTLIYYYG